VNDRADAVDARIDRLVQSTVGVILLAAFVFGFPVVLPALALLLGAGGLAGPPANVFHWAYSRGLAGRLPPDDATVPYETVRAQDLLGAAILVVASGAYAIGLGPVAWLLAVAEAGIAIVAATTGLHLGEYIRSQLRRDG
jgi:hypothetical protein